MILTLQAGQTLQADVQLPASKSISNRASVLDALSHPAKTGELLKNLAVCDDTAVMSEALTFKSNKIDIGAAGTSMRFLTAFLAGREGSWEITGSERMKNRPIRVLADALNELGADISYMEKEGFPPLKIEGKKLKGGSISIDGGISSQYLSALMMAGPAMENGLTLNINGKLISRPYFDMTLAMMKQWGAEATVEENTVRIEPQPYHPIPFTVESDWSAASYWYEMLSLAESGEVFLRGLTPGSLQGDARVAEWFEDLEVHTEFVDGGVRLTRSDRCVSRFEADFTDQPDLAQTFAVTCALKAIPFRLTGLQSLRIKETDRLTALVNEAEKLGFRFLVEGDSVLEWKGELCTMQAIPIKTYDDHRMAMAFAPAALAFGIVSIQNPEVVSKSYPEYWKDLEKAGFYLIEEKDRPSFTQ